MTKQDLLEKYTPEQLADRIIELEKLIAGNNMFNSLQSKIQSPLQQSIVDSYEEKIKQKEAKISRLEKERGDFRNQRDAQITKVNELKTELQRKENTMNQIDDILNKLFGVTHDVAKTPDEFEKILKEKMKNSKTIEDFLMAEPIKVADMLINAEIEPKKIKNGIELIEHKRNFKTSELREIAEHLLIYCNATKGEKE